MARPRVYLARCLDYEERTVESALAAALEGLGGIGSFISSGERVFLKVNLLMGKAPESAVTTHPSVIRAAIRVLESAGASVVVGDSPAGPFTRGLLELAYRRSRIPEALEGTGAGLNRDLSSVRVPNPGGRMVKNLEVMRVVAEADKVVSLPKVKTHALTRFTGAVKNLYGVVPGTVKAAYHAKLPDAREFSEMLLDVAQCASPSLTIMDGVVGMEGNGPSGGEPKELGALIVSGDMAATDVVACSLIGIDPLSVPTNLAAMDRGLTTGRLEDVEVLGERVEDLRMDFALPRKSGTAAPRFILDIIGSAYTKPRPSPSKCIGCGGCVEACPRGCISLKRGVAVVDYRGCIRCFCCHEICPEKAVELR